MKRSILIIVALLVNVVMFSQNGPVDDMFAKYSGQNGITSISISSKMFSMLAGADLQDEDLNNLMKQLKTIRIITVDSSALNKKINFNEELSKKLNPSVYEELMVVKEGSKVTRYLTSMTGNTISELVVVTGGTAGNELISIKGDIDLKNISSLSRKLGIDQLKSLEMIDKQVSK
jgi:hypothetical protein